jgi:DNA-binding NarL/FixJ family response regulator
VIRVVLADDQTLVRGGFRMILEAQDDIEVVAEADDGAQAVRAVRETSPNVVLMDVRMPGMNGVEATAELSRQRRDARVLILTTFDLDEYVYEAVKAGASGFLLKDVAPAELVHAVRVVATGDALVAPAITRRLLEQFVSRPRPGEAVPEALHRLTPREVDVLRQVARGLSNAEIAGALHLGEATVKTHMTRVLAKLGLRDRAQAVVAAYESGLFRPGASEAGPRRPDAEGHNRR